ncbi:UDP-N-acetylglucosamine transferase subunit [Desmophyllum pertusum]|uniref:UDP-N-acetylglucosamine transferase subunit ALG14 n=1 Tax=Desmophyllum pertusum TaxID=174260 RepID=A0A9W9ZRL0_9CNID|nr:UDP-N-acetylglucosamine transferase subunit [Desmophyllum pertusum]
MLRTVYVLKRKRNHASLDRRKPVKVMVVAGSGGHTTEMIRLLGSLSSYYHPRIYVVAETDKMSAEKITSFERNKEEKDKESSEFKILRIPRSREVRQSWLSTIFTTLNALVFSFPVVLREKPELLLCNGPGTCIPICLAAFVLKVAGLRDITMVFVESMCRVKTLSLSGKIMYHFADHFLVQWKQLQINFPKAIYLGAWCDSVPFKHTKTASIDSRPLHRGSPMASHRNSPVSFANSGHSSEGDSSSAGPQFFFTDIAHSKDLVTALKFLRQDEDLCDVVLRVGGSSISAHKVVLAASSPYFKAMFAGT